MEFLIILIVILWHHEVIGIAMLEISGSTATSFWARSSLQAIMTDDDMRNVEQTKKEENEEERDTRVSER